MCLQRKDHLLATHEYEQISRPLVAMLRDHPLTVYEATVAMPHQEEEEVIEVIRWMIDSGMLDKDGDDVLTLRNAGT